MRSQRIFRLVIAALFAAIIYIFTALFHVPAHTGYTHIGDAFIFLAASILPLPYAVVAAVIGAGLADLLSGYVIWLPATVVIKALSVLSFSSGEIRLLTRRNVLALVPAWVLCIGGYYLYEGVITGNFYAALAGIPGYVIQSLFSTIVYLASAILLDRVRLKQRFFR